MLPSWPTVTDRMTDLKHIARQIFLDALAAVDVRAAVQREIAVTQDALTIANRAVPLSKIDRIIIIALGKAAVPMHAAARKALAHANIRIDAIVVAPEETHDNASFFSGAHPLPDERSIIAARAVLDALHTCDDRTAVLFLISGGASAMLELPLDEAISIEDIRALNQALIGSGLRIEQMNALRKHLSAVKGGRLATAAQEARQQWSLLISDVPAAAPDVIASGPSLPDHSTLADANSALQRIGMKNTLPQSIEHFVQSDRFTETPRASDPGFARSTHKVILSSEHLAEAAAEAARNYGYEPIIDNTCDDWDWIRAGEYLLSRAQQLLDHGGRYCLISVGEVTVELPADPGIGGRNQQLACWLAFEIERRESELPITALSAGSDGIDGSSNAAGAVVDRQTIQEARQQTGRAPKSYFDHFDTGALFAKTGHAIITGPTGNNLRDLRLFLIDSTLNS